MPIFVTEYATGATSFNGNYYNEPTHGNYNNNAVDSPEYASRTLNNTMMLLNQGVNYIGIYRLFDYDWHHTTWGLITSPRRGRNKRPIYDLLKYTFQHLNKNSLILKDDSTNRNRKVKSLAVKKENTITVILNNEFETEEEIELDLNLGQYKITKAHEGSIATKTEREINLNPKNLSLNSLYLL